MSWARDSIRVPVRQPYCSLLAAQLHAKLISLGSKTRYAVGYVRWPVVTRKFVRIRVVEGPAAGGMARRVGLRSRGQPAAGDRLCRRACRALDLDPDQSQGG